MDSQTKPGRDFKKFFKAAHFKRIDAAFRRHFRLGIETIDRNAEPVPRMCSRSCQPRFCNIIRQSKAAERCRQDRLRSLNIAFETGQPYICICHAGIVLVCVPIMEADLPLGGLFFGKCLWEAPAAEIENDVVRRLLGIRIDTADLTDSLYDLPVVTSRRIHDAAEFLFILLYEATGLDPRVINWRRQRTLQQAEISDYIQRSKRNGTIETYPYEDERRLIEKVKIGDRTGSNEILNSLLGNIMFRNPGDLNVLKARLLELLSVLSRAAAEGGVNIDQLLKRNLDYTKKVLDIDSQEDLCAWISSALHEFTDSVYALRDSRKNTKIGAAVKFIEANYANQIGIHEVAKAIHLSQSRAAHLFKDCMGATIIDYLTQVRIARARDRLLATDETCTEIGFAVGYNSQSYFIRAFKALGGMTPRQFREANLRSAQT